ncbi:GMC family oxidoreductase N-terminal domain-containing protein [Nocardioides sp. TF02-7]|uniref:GMC family oxidoreductase N-terminal domain-containing protein n=1 Tax=Nocardioides sp. TF02-7 TaxID=2917724 RepID=UPI001F063344|nr:GMC family oxidoreductase N-terminal domain-containing protein [Nocardioides sp. TF02-7]UMG92396.1 GMC family oxidoreductase N-terminal domain-containing protein [Nocardioides sp. TF02-7]
MPRNVLGCDQDVECGRCGLGCRLGAKQSVTKTWLEDAYAAGARIYTGVTARRVTSARGRATGVEAVSAEGHRVVVRSRAVVAAAGALQTPALLKRSGLANPNIGRHLRLHPATAVLGLMDEPVDGWVGSMQSRYVDALADLDGDGYGVLLETAPVTPAFGANFVPWEGAAPFHRRMADLRRSLGVVVLVRDRDSVGTVDVDRTGEPVVRYRLSAHDTEHLVQGLVGAARVAEAAGARRVETTHHLPLGFEPGVRGSVASYEADIRARGLGPGRLALASLHLMGSARMGGSPVTSAVDPDGQAWDLPGLYVADGSCFPTASGVNPMISIGSITHLTASRLASRLAD